MGFKYLWITFAIFCFIHINILSACAPPPPKTTNIDNCSPNPCQNGGACIDGVNKYTCICRPGYTGNDCQTNINECIPDPCQNGGGCVDGVNNYTCICKPGYDGSECQTNIDDCTPDPCENGGGCVDGVNKYTCICKPGYTGNKCQSNIDDCTPDPCLNGGRCVDEVNKYTCICRPGFTGSECQIRRTGDCSFSLPDAADKDKIFGVAGGAGVTTLPNCAGTPAATCTLASGQTTNIIVPSGCNDDSVRILYNGRSKCIWYETNPTPKDNDIGVNGNGAAVPLSCTNAVLSGALTLEGNGGTIPIDEITELRCDGNGDADKVDPPC